MKPALIDERAAHDLTSTPGDTSSSIELLYLQQFRPIVAIACAVAFFAGWAFLHDSFLLRMAAGLGVSFISAMSFAIATRRCNVERLLMGSVVVDTVFIAVLVTQLPNPALANMGFIWSIVMAALLLDLRLGVIASSTATTAACIIGAARHAPPAEIVTGIIILAVAAVSMLYVRERERRTAARAQALSHQLQQAEQLAQIGSWTMYANGDRAVWSPQMYRLFGLPVGSPVSGQSIEDAIVDEDRDKIVPFQQAFMHGTPCDVTLGFRFDDGNERVLRIVGTPTGTPRDRAMVGSVTDVTAQHRLNTLRQRFVATASHELRTPTTVVLGFAETLDARWDQISDADRRQYVNLVCGSARRLAQLTEDLLLVTHIEAGTPTIRPERIDLATELLDECVAFAGSVSLSMPSDGVSVHADPSRVRQIISNLVGNATRYAPDAQITVFMDVDDARGTATVSVRDEGPGIQYADQERIFDQFVRIDTDGQPPHGSGLGLFICRELVTAMGGEIGVRSTPGAGSTFHFTLPLADSRSLVR